MKQPSVYLKAGKEKAMSRRHPWIFSGAIDRVEGQPELGGSVSVRTQSGQFLAWAAYSPQSKIRCRVWSWTESRRIDAAHVRELVRAAVAYRHDLGLGAQACRLVHGEADALPGVICDRYGDLLVLQLTSAGAERWRDALVEALQSETGCTRIYERSDVDVREIEGLELRRGWLRGDGATEIEIDEGGVRYWVDVARGQKTGFYLDQRDNRALIRTLAQGREVLNCFCYTGGFSLAAMAGGAKNVLSIDSSAEALNTARQNVAMNGYDETLMHWQEADVFQALRELRNAGRQFELIVLDPPKFAPTIAHAEKAARAYKDINLWGLKLLRPGGLLATFSCSGGISLELLQKIVAGAASDAEVDARILERFQVAPDHPIRMSFPEGEYLKGLLLKRI
ncbi:MAG TPA: class I SAM-dependent rRNA methyltransferase [Burkholderiales bacterium]|nr:class I SAM-dependent rRNA methyltransferase [Burkholderiales bacterium]